ncbi:MAG TPA: type II toxin-antitoxin system PemK/MazF family toxin [Dehalococcoidia bacterium]|nr:type II toxin-antitoxin system PemK/MazF family toxin [Dehalococcoidia bacterium]
MPDPRRGEIWYIYTPGLPRDPHQLRPGLVISDDTRNRRRDDLLVIPVFSTARLGPTRVALRAGTGGIDHDSALFCEEISTIDRDFFVDGPLGPPVPESILQSTLRAVRRALGEVIPEP